MSFDIEMKPSLCSTCKLAQPRRPGDDSGVLVCTWRQSQPEPMWMTNSGVVFRMVPRRHWVGRPLDTCPVFEAKAA